MHGVVCKSRREVRSMPVCVCNCEGEEGGGERGGERRG